MDVDFGDVLRGVGAAAVAVLGVALIAWLAWLAGLIVSLWDTKPEERPKILRAYGSAQPGKAIGRWHGKRRR